MYRYTLAVLAISLLSNIPVFFEFKADFDTETQSNTIHVTQLRTDKIYIIVFKNVFEGIVLMILPLASMVCLNARIIYTLRKRRRTISETGYPRRVTNEMNLATVLVAMDFVFLICNLGRVIVNIWEIFQIGQMKECIEKGLPYQVHFILKTTCSLLKRYIFIITCSQLECNNISDTFLYFRFHLGFRR